MTMLTVARLVIINYYMVVLPIGSITRLARPSVCHRALRQKIKKQKKNKTQK